ncbi:MAG TPA: CHRD domain-containing protein [Caulobacteraceae bacterium]|jgi:hypothetical protein|nr:CHRD domain-containing protein [Caulobacteraceae bacterium]
MLTKAIAAGAALLLFTAGAADAAVFDVNATLKGVDQGAPGAAAASGTLSGELDSNTKAFSYEVNYSGLSGPVTAAHFQGATAPGSQPAVAAQSPARPIEGTTTLTDADIANLEAGKWSLDLQTAAHPNGEISGQLQATRREDQNAIPLN